MIALLVAAVLPFGSKYVKKPDEAPALATVCELAPEISAAAKVYGVDREVVAGVIFAEAALYSRPKHLIERWAMKNHIVDNGRFANRYFGFSPGQVHVDVARKVEPFCARMEKRDQRSDAEVAAALKDDAKAVLYAACILRNAQNVYAEHGFPIDKDVNILATTFNIGRVEQLAAGHQARGDQPQANQFGLYVGQFVEKRKTGLYRCPSI